MPQDQADSISEAAEELRMSRQDVIRQTLRLYLPDFRERMSPKPKLRKTQSVCDALHFGRGINVEFKPIQGSVKKIEL